MIIRFFPLLLTLLLVLSSSVVNAHTNKANKVELQLLSDNKYQLIMNVDILHLIKKQQNFSGDEAELVFYLQGLSLIETKLLLKKVTQKIDEQSAFVVVDNESNEQERILVAPFSGLTIAEFRQRLLPNFINTPIALFSRGNFPSTNNKISLVFPPVIGNVLLTTTTPKTSWVLSGELSYELPVNVNHLANQNVSSYDLELINIAQYIYQGFVHILPKGLDHILFVLALFLLATKTSTLLWQVSAFTLAHTITLALGIFGIINLPSTIVEPLIALSIAFVAIENIYQKKLTRWRLPIIFAFGLLHGLGFASVLVEFGLPESQYVSSLISFNVGVELGQITVILAAFLATRWIAKTPDYRKLFVIPVSALIAIIALYWFVERTFNF